MKRWMACAACSALLLSAASANETDNTVTAATTPEPTLIDRTTETVGAGVETVRSATVSATRKTVEHGGQWIEQGKQGAGEAWSKTREISGAIATKTVEGAGVGVDYIRDGTGKLVDKTVDVSEAAWQSTKEHSSTAWNKSREVANRVKKEVVGTEESQAEVIDKSTPAEIQ